MKLVPLTLLVLIASPAAWAEGLSHEAPAKSLPELIDFFSGRNTVLQPRQSALTGGSSLTVDSPGPSLNRRDIGRNFTAARYTGRGISLKPMYQQTNIASVARPR